jgi:hypothetical protein
MGKPIKVYVVTNTYTWLGFSELPMIYDHFTKALISSNKSGNHFIFKIVVMEYDEFLSMIRNYPDNYAGKYAQTALGEEKIAPTEEHKEPEITETMGNVLPFPLSN